MSNEPIKSFYNSIQEYFSGIVLASWISGVSLWLSFHLSSVILSPLLLSAVFGIFIRNTIGVPEESLPGVVFSAKKVLRIAVILLGLKISFYQISEIGMSGLVIVYFCSVSTFIFTCWLGRRFRIKRTLYQLIASGTSICGASAIIATNAAIDGSEEDVSYSITMVTFLGTVAMLVYPLTANLLNLTPTIFGLWCGASIHEVAQVIAASFQNSELSGEIATVSKLARVILIIPLISILSFQESISRSKQTFQQTTSKFPWFILLFAFLAVINSFNIFPEEVLNPILMLNQALLCMAMASMGLMTSFSSLVKIGIKPLYLAAISWLYLGSISFFLLKFFLVL